MIPRAALQKRILDYPLEAMPVSTAARFLPITPYWGFKFFYYAALDKSPEQLRDHTYALQHHASLYGVAPKLGRKENLQLRDIPAYGYYTRLVTPFNNFCTGASFADICRDHRLALTQLHAIGIELADTDVSNFGQMADGRLVMFDFSHCGFTKG